MSYVIGDPYTRAGIFRTSRGLGQEPTVQIYEMRAFGPYTVAAVKPEYMPGVGIALATMGVSDQLSVSWAYAVGVSARSPIAAGEVSAADWAAQQYAAGRGVLVEWHGGQSANVVAVEPEHWQEALAALSQGDDTMAVFLEPMSVAPAPSSPSPEPALEPPQTSKAVAPWRYVAVGAVAISVGAIAWAMFHKGKAAR